MSLQKTARQRFAHEEQIQKDEGVLVPKGCWANDHTLGGLCHGNESARGSGGQRSQGVGRALLPQGAPGEEPCTPGLVACISHPCFRMHGLSLSLHVSHKDPSHRMQRPPYSNTTRSSLDHSCKDQLRLHSWAGGGGFRTSVHPSGGHSSIHTRSQSSTSESSISSGCHDNPEQPTLPMGMVSQEIRNSPRVAEPMWRVGQRSNSPSVPIPGEQSCDSPGEAPITSAPSPLWAGRLPDLESTSLLSVMDITSLFFFMVSLPVSTALKHKCGFAFFWELYKNRSIGMCPFSALCLPCSTAVSGLIPAFPRFVFNSFSPRAMDSFCC